MMITQLFCDTPSHNFSIVDYQLASRRQVLTAVGTGTTIAMAGCSALGGGGPKATAREFLKAFCNKDAETANQLASENYGTMGGDEYTKDNLPDGGCSINNLREYTPSRRGRPPDAVGEMKFYKFTFTIDGERQTSEIALGMVNGEWKVLDIG